MCTQATHEKSHYNLFSSKKENRFSSNVDQAPDDNNDAAEEVTQEEEKKCSVPVAAEVAPGSTDIVAAADIKYVKPIRDSYLCFGSDPETDTVDQCRGPSTSDTKIEGPTLIPDVNTGPSEMTSGSGVVSVLNTSVPTLITSAYSCPVTEGPSS